MLETFKSIIVLAVPSNQFNQEPLTAKQSEQYFRSNYNLGNTIFFTEKVCVDGPFQHPLYKWMTKQRTYFPCKTKIRWNYEKFIILNEKVISRFKPSKVLNTQYFT